MWIEGLDELDNHILEILKDNARLSFTDIAAKCNVTRVSVKNRMEALEQKGIIRGYRTIIDSTALPEGTKFFLEIETYADSYHFVIESIAKSSMIREIYGITGDCRIRAIGFAPDNRYLQSYVDRLMKNTNGIRRIGVHTVLSTYKNIDGGVDYVKSVDKESNEPEHLEGV